jgi:hypothetical protein
MRHSDYQFRRNISVTPMAGGEIVRRIKMTLTDNNQRLQASVIRHFGGSALRRRKMNLAGKVHRK